MVPILELAVTGTERTRLYWKLRVVFFLPHRILRASFSTIGCGLVKLQRMRIIAPFISKFGACYANPYNCLFKILQTLVNAYEMAPILVLAVTWPERTRLYWKLRVVFCVPHRILRARFSTIGCGLVRLQRMRIISPFISKFGACYANPYKCRFKIL